MGGIDDYERVTAANRSAWRRWLAQNHDSSPGAWLVFFKAGSGRKSLTWSEAVDEALCFGWIDSKVQTIDDSQYEQYFTRRKPTSPWSKLNKEKVAVLQAQGRMEPAGEAAVEAAKHNGSWSILDGPEAGVVPEDLAAAFPDEPAREFFDALPPSTKRNILQWIALAKRSETRTRRIDQTAEAARHRTTPGSF